jgi:hypothetical protein
VWIEEPPDAVGWTIRIEGPARVKWQYEFFGQEQTPEFIQSKVWWIWSVTIGRGDEEYENSKISPVSAGAR